MAERETQITLRLDNQTRQGFREVSRDGKRSASDVQAAYKSISSTSGDTSRQMVLHSSQAGAATRALVQILASVGPESTKAFASATGAAMDFKSAADGAGKSWGGFEDGAKRAGDAIDEVEAKVDNFRKKLGAGLLAGAAGGTAILGKSVGLAASMETQLKTIEAITGSAAEARRIFGEIDKMSVESAFDLPDLTRAGKTLTANRMFSTQTLRAADDLAAVKKDEGVRPQDVVRALGRLKAQDWGEGFERLRDFGVGPDDLKAKGLKFENGEYQDKTPEGAQKAIDAVIAVIEERFGGLSKKIASETLEGSLTNMGDAIGRLARGIGEELVPAVTVATKLITGMVTAFANMPDWMQKVIAWGGVLVIALSTLGAALLIGAKVIGGLKLAWVGLSWVMGVTGTSIGGLSTMLLTRLLPAVVTATTGIGAAAAKLLLHPLFAGVALGAGGAEIIRRAQVASGDKGAAGSFGEMLSNAQANLGLGGEAVQMEGTPAQHAAWKAAQKKKEAVLAATGGPAAATAAGAIPGMAGMDTGAVGNIEALEDELRSLAPGKETAARRKELQNQIFYARRAKRHEREAEAQRRKDETAREKAEREALKTSGLNASVDSSAATGGLDERGASLQGSAGIAESREKRALARQTREIRRQVKSGAMTDEAGDAKIESLKAALDARNKAREADLEMQIAGINAQKEIIESQARAAGQTGVQRESTLAIGQNRAARIMGMAREKAALLREEVLDLQEAAAERLQEAAESMRGIADQLRKKGVGASWGGPAADGGSMLRMATGNYGGGDSFVGNNAALMAAGIARAQGNSYAGRASYSADAIENRFTQDVPVKGRGIREGALTRFVFEDVLVEDGNNRRLSRSSAVML